MQKARQASLYLMLLCTALSVLWGFSLNRSTPGGIMGFPGIYYGTRCLLHGCDPYNQGELQSFYQTEGAAPATESIQRRQSVTLYVNLPPTFLFVAAFAMLPFKTAMVFWNLLIEGCFLLGTWLIWSVASKYASALTTACACIVLVNCEIIFAGGNTAGLVVGLCLVAVWCLLHNRFVLAGVACFAISLVIKPHDGGLVWLCFLLAGGRYRKRALQSLLVASLFAAVSFIWVYHVAPHWLSEFRANLANISAPNGINDPAPHSIGMNSPDIIIDLQTVVSLFWSQPFVYNALTYFLCAIPLVFWIVTTLRTRMTTERIWFALAAVVPLTMLFTYHRSYDAKLTLLCLPACAMLWRDRKRTGWIAALLTLASLTAIGDIPMASLVFVLRHWHITAESWREKLFLLTFARPAPVLLFLLAVFYLWVYWKMSKRNNAAQSEATAA